MKADITRDTAQPGQHYRRVIHQQGRVPLDADLNEGFEIQEHVDRITDLDVVGPVGVPKGDSFALSLAPGGTDLLLAPGRLHAAGLVCELDAAPVAVTSTTATTIVAATFVADGRPLAVGDWIELRTSTSSAIYQLSAVDAATSTLTVKIVAPTPAPNAVTGTGPTIRRRASYTRQPDLPAPPSVTTTGGLPALGFPSGAYLAYVDVWEHHTTAIEDPEIREVALGGADTATRAKLVWQLKLAGAGAAHAKVDCQAALPQPPQPRGALAARAKLVPQQTDPCIVDPIAKYRRLSNQLYRVEVHAGGALGDGTCSFKFSRDNGSVLASWVAQSPPSTTTVAVALPGRDAGRAFAANQWIELLDDTTELAGTPGTLVQIASIDGNVLTLKSGTATGSTDRTAFPLNPRVRGWDQTAATLAVQRPSADGGWLMLEDGVQVRFEPGAYATGDYWLIPARTIDGDVEWPAEPTTGNPLPRAAAGIEHTYAAIAIVDVDSGVVTVRDHDCRVQFPPLTHICATDVCVEGSPCGKPWKTVQEALDDLCQDNDLEFHNQHLHGWGVVCGLQVECLKVADGADLQRPREHVDLEAGYAIDPHGVDIREKKARIVDVGQMVLDAGIAKRDAKGNIPDLSVSMWIEPGTPNPLHVEKYDPTQKLTLTDFLDGTIWMDFYNGCLKPVIDWVKAQIEGAPGEVANGPVTPAMKRLITILNLFEQLINQTNGRYVYLSGEVAGDPTKPSLDKEDGILRVLYAGLRGLLQSETFCGMFDDITLPAYDVFKANLPATTPRPNTIFGKGCQRRVRIDPDAKFALTCGNGGTIGVYDLTQARMVSEATFPSQNVTVTDVLVRKVLNTLQVVAVANLGAITDKDSEIVVGTLAADGTITWTNNRVTCSLSFQTLAAVPGDNTRVYAAARGDGVYVILPDAPLKVPDQVGASFHAEGGLVAGLRDGKQQLLFATAHSTTAFPSTYDTVRQLDMASPTSPTDYALGTTGQDVIEVAIDAKNKMDYFLVVTGSGTAKHLRTYKINTTASPMQDVALNENGDVRLAYSSRGGCVMVTLADNNTGRGYRPGAQDLETDVHPLQLAPIWAQTNAGAPAWYVLNWLSNTITVIPTDYSTGSGLPPLTPWQSTIDINKLATYRTAFINAFLETIGRFFQYLKDCFCQQLLIKCPDPKGKKVYLCDIAFKNGEVYQICNFGRRRYVHTFPTVEYWMSIIPIIPAVRIAVEKVCCSVIGGFFDKLAIQQQPKADKVPIHYVKGSADAFQALDVKTRFGNLKAQSLLTGGMLSKSLMDSLSRPRELMLPSAAPLGATAILDRKKEVVTSDLASRNITVGNIHTVDGPSAATYLRTAVAPPAVPSGSTVDLYVDGSGNVVSYGYSPSTVTAISSGNDATKAELTAALATRDQTIADLSGKLAAVQTAQTTETSTVNAALAQRDATIADLNTKIATMQTQQTAANTQLAGLKTSIDTLTASHAAQIKTLTENIAALQKSIPQRG
jgi:hypothetical protein